MQCLLCSKAKHHTVLINSWCAAKIAVFGLCVCLSVFLSIPASEATRWPMSNTNSFEKIREKEMKRGFFKEPLHLRVVV